MDSKDRWLIFSMVASWFSRGCFGKICYQMEEAGILLIGLLIGIVVGPIIQGNMADKIPRKQAIVYAQLGLLGSLILMGYIVTAGAISVSFPFVGALAINSFFGNVSPACAATLSDKGMKFEDAAGYMRLAKILGIVLAIVMPLGNIQLIGVALALNAIAFAGTYWKFPALDQGKC